MANLLGITDGKKSGSTTLEKKGRTQIARYKDEITYIVVASCTETRQDVEATSGVPQLNGIVYVGNIVTKCIDVSSKEISTIAKDPFTGNMGILWEVTCQFDTNLDQDEDNNNKDPTEFNPDISWSSEKEKKPLITDLDGLPIQTSAGEKIPYEEDVVYSVLEVTRFEKFPFDEDLIDEYVGACNSSTFRGTPKGCWICDEITTRMEIIQSRKYEKVTYRLRKLRGSKTEDTIAKVSLANVGTMYMRITGAVGDLVPGGGPYEATTTPSAAKDAKGQPIKVRLRAEIDNSAELRQTPLIGTNYYDVISPVGDILKPDEETEYLDFRVKRYADFDKLNLDKKD